MVELFGPTGSGGLFDRGLLGTLGIGELLGKPDTEAFEDLASTQERLALQLAQMSEMEQARRLRLQDPLRQALFGSGGDLRSFLTTGELPVSLQTPFSATQDAIAQQGQNVREDIIGRIGAQGGQLRNLLTEQRLSEAAQVAQLPLLEQPIRSALFQSALGAALGQEFPIASSLGAGIGGLSQAAGTLATGEQLQLQFKENIAGLATGLASPTGGATGG